MIQRLKDPQFLLDLFLLLAIAVVNVLTRDPWSISAIGWLLPILLVRFFRSYREPSWAVMAGLVLILENIAAAHFTGASNMRSIFYVGIASGLTLLPFYLDRIFLKKLTPLLSTLIVPTSWVLLLFFFTIAGGGMYVSPFYLAADNPVFLQSASFSGPFIILFIVLWLAPIVNNLFDDKSKENKVNLLIYISLPVLIGAFGLFRISQEKSYSGVKLSLIDSQYELPEFFSGQMAVTDLPQAMKEVYEMAPFSSAGYAAMQGGEVLLWSNGFSIDKESVKAFKRPAQKLAKDLNVFLFFPLLEVEAGGGEELFFAGFDNLGGSALYEAAVEGGEHILETPYGKMGAVRLKDYLNLKSSQADLLVVYPAPFGKYSPPQSAMIIKAIELGVNVVFQEGSSVKVFSGRGRLLKETDLSEDNYRTDTFAIPLQEFRGTTMGRPLVVMIISLIAVAIVGSLVKPAREAEK